MQNFSSSSTRNFLFVFFFILSGLAIFTFRFSKISDATSNQLKRNFAFVEHSVIDKDSACIAPSDAQERINILSASSTTFSSSTSQLSSFSLSGFGNPLKPRKPVHLALCVLINADDAIYLHEWVAFHRAVGVGRISIWIDDADETDGNERYTNVMSKLSIASTSETSNINVYSVKRHLLNATEALVLAIETTKNAFRSYKSNDNINYKPLRYCGPDENDISDLLSITKGCAKERTGTNHVHCQISVTRLAAAWSKFWRDGFLMLTDIDEFIFPTRTLPGCSRGGCPYDESGIDSPLLRGPSLLQTIEAYLGPSSTRLRLVELGLSSYIPGDGSSFPSPSSIGSMFASLAIYGSMFGTNGKKFANWTQVEGLISPQSLVTVSHPKSAPYDRFGFKIPPSSTCSAPAFGRIDICGAADPQKSIIRINEHLPISGIAVHVHDVGPIRYLNRVAGEYLQYSHYSYLSTEETYLKKVLRNHNPSDSVPALVSRNEEGIDDWFSSWENSGASDFAPLIWKCMQKSETLAYNITTECGYPIIEV
jgi:hypothetical protein